MTQNGFDWLQMLLMQVMPWDIPQQSESFVHLSYSAEHLGAFDVHARPASLCWQ